MKKNMCCIKCNKHKKLKNPKMLYIFNKKLVFYIIWQVWQQCSNDKVFKEEESIEILKVLGLIDNINE